MRAPSRLLRRAQVQPGMARDLFPAGFVSCWGELEGSMQAGSPSPGPEPAY